MYENYLIHYGILGMKWGVRRYQNRDGSLTPEGRKRLGIKIKNDSPRHTPSSARKRQIEANNKVLKEKREKEEKEKFEANKQKALEKGNASDVLKYKGSLSNRELQDAFNRINLERQLSSIAASEVKTTWDKIDSVVNKASKIKNYADRGIEVYNLFVKVHNSFSDENSQLKAIDGKTPQEKTKEKKIEKLVRTGNADQLLKSIGSLSNKELDDAMKRINYEERLRKMIDEDNKKKEQSK